MAHRNPNAKPVTKSQTGNTRRGNEEATKQARRNANSIRNNVKKSLTKFGEKTSPGTSRSTNTPAVSNTPTKSRRDLNVFEEAKKLPWVANPNRQKAPEDTNINKPVTVPAHSLSGRNERTVNTKSSRAEDLHTRVHDYYVAKSTKDAAKTEADVKQLTRAMAKGMPMWKDPKSLTASDIGLYDPVTGRLFALDRVAHDLNTTPEEYISEETQNMIADIEEAATEGYNMETGRYSADKDESYFQKLNKKNYYKERQYDDKTQQYKDVYVIKLNAEMPELTVNYDLMGDYIDTWTYEKNGKTYRKEGAPELPYEFDDDGNYVSTNYDYYTVNEDGSWELHKYTEKDLQKLENDWMIYCALSNASNISAREITERMGYTAGWNPEETDSVMDFSRDALADASVRDYKEYSKGNRQGMRSMVGPHTVSHLFKNVGGYLKTYLFTPLSKGDMRTTIMNGLVNLAETCDYAGIGTRALAAPWLNKKFGAGIEYEKDDTAWERVARAYTTHHNYDPDSGSMGKDMLVYTFADPSILFTLGSAGLAKTVAKRYAMTALDPLERRLIKYGDTFSDFDSTLTKEYKSISRDIAFADDTAIEKHAARVTELLKESNYYKGTSESAVLGEIKNDLINMQNEKAFLVVKATAGASEFINGIDSFFLKGGLYLPYTTLKTIQGTRHILRNNARVAEFLTSNAFKRYLNAQRIYKDYSGGGSILDFRHVIDGFKDMKSLDPSDELKEFSLEKKRRHYLRQQSEFAKAISKFRTSKGGFTQRYGVFNDEIKRIFKNSDTGESVKSLDELERTLIEESRKAAGVSKSCEDIFKNMLRAVEDAKKSVELHAKNDVNNWLTAIMNASSSRDVRRLYSEYLSTNSANRVLKIESVAGDRYKWMYAQEHGISEDLVVLPNDMLVIESARANGLNSVPNSKSTIENVALDSDYVAIARFVGDAPDAVKKEVSDVQKFVNDLVKKDADGNILTHKSGDVKLIVEDRFVRELYEYIGHVSKNDLSKLELSEVLTKTGRALDSLRGKYKYIADDVKMPTAEDLAKFLENSEEAKATFVYSGGIESMQKLYDLGVYDYYMLVRTKESPQMYLPSLSKDELREAKLEFQKNKLHEDANRRAYREMAADPNGVIQRKYRLKQKLQSTEFKNKDGVKVSAYDEYKTLVSDYKKWAEANNAVEGLIESLDVAFNDVADVLALTEAQAEKAYGVNMAMSTYLGKTLANPVIMDAVHKFDPEGPYGFLIEYKNEIEDFLKQNIAVGRNTPYVDKLLHAIDAIETWKTSLYAYENFSETIKNLELGPREEAVVLEYCLGKDPSYFREATRSPYFIQNLSEVINRRLGSDRLLIDGYREAIQRTSHIDEGAWKADHIKHVKSCEKDIAEISEYDVKLQILQAIELDPGTIKRFNDLAELQDVWFIKPVIDGKSPDSAVVRFELQKWTHIDEDISLPDLLKVLKDEDGEYSHILEVSDKLTEKDAMQQVVDILDGSIKSGPGVKHLTPPMLVTHGRDVFDIDVLRQCCSRNDVNSALLSNTNALFANRINTFKELMMHNTDHKCIDPDKFSDISLALRTLSQDLPENAEYSIFNVSHFSRDLNTLFDTLLDPALIKEALPVYSGDTNPFLKRLIEDEEEIKAMAIDAYDEADMVKNISDTLEKREALAAKEDVNNKRAIDEVFREKLWKIKNLNFREVPGGPTLLEEKLNSFKELAEEVNASKWYLESPIYNTRSQDIIEPYSNEVRQIVLLNDLKQARSKLLKNLELLQTYEDPAVLKELLSYFTQSNQHFPDTTIYDFIDDITRRTDSYIFKSVLNYDTPEALEKGIQQLEDDVAFLYDANDILKNYALFFETPKVSYKALNRGVRKGLSRFIPEYNVKSPTQAVADAIKSEAKKEPGKSALTSNKEDEELIKRNASKPTIASGPTPWFRSLYQPYHTNSRVSNAVENQVINAIKEQKELEILPETFALRKEFADILDSISFNVLKVFDSKSSILAEFNQIKIFADKYILDVKIPQAVRNNLICISRVIDQLDTFTHIELDQFKQILQEFDTDLNDMLSMLSRTDSGYNFTYHVEETFSNYNRKAALLQQKMLILQNDVSNRVFKDVLKVTDSSPIIRDIFKPITEMSPVIGDMCSAVKNEVKNLDRIRSSQVNSCLSSNEFDGFADGYALYDLPMGASSELKFDMSGDAYRVSKAFDLDNIKRIFNLSTSREGHIFETPDSRWLVEQYKVTYDLLNEARRLTDNIDELEKSISLHESELSKLEQVDELTSKYEEELEKLNEEFATEDVYKETIENQKTLLDKTAKEFFEYRVITKIENYIKDLKTELIETRKKGLHLQPEQVGRLEEAKILLGKARSRYGLSEDVMRKGRTYDRYVSEYKAFKGQRDAVKAIEDKLSELPSIDEKYWEALSRHEEALSHTKKEYEALIAEKQEVMDHLMSNYYTLKKTEAVSKTADGTLEVISKTKERELFNDIQKVIEDSRDVTVRVSATLEDIPSHELTALNKFANRVKHIRENKLIDSSFLDQISTLDDWNAIINQTRQFAASLDTSDPFHYFIYLKDADTIEEAFITTDLLYNMFYKHWEDLKKINRRVIDEGLMHIPNMYKKTVSRIMHYGYDSVKLKIFENPDIVKILQGDGLDLVYKGQPKSYLDTVYYQNKINGKHAASANITSILEKQNNRLGWAQKFAGLDKSIREGAFNDLENSQVEMLKILNEVSGTPYELPCRLYLDNLQNGLYRARDLKILDYITKSEDHLITHLLYHNGHLNIALRYSDDFTEYGSYLKKLEELLDKNPMYISYKYEKDYVWVSLSRDADPKVLNDSKYVKEDTRYELGNKVYDPTEMNEHYSHIGLPDDIELTAEMLKDVKDEAALRSYCERLREYTRGCYEKISFLTDGAIKGSAFAPYTLMKHRALRKAAPTDWLADSIRGSATCDQRLFHTSQFDFNILGENEFKFKLGGHYDDTDILQNIKHCYDDLVGTVSTERMYIANFFDENSHCKLENIFGSNFTDADILKVLKQNPDQTVLTLVADAKTMTGFRVQKLRITDELSVRQAKEAHAIIADYETYVEMTRLINTSELDKVWMKAWARMVFLLKVGHLCNPGTWMRNWIDATIKATGEVDGNVAKIAMDQIHAIRYLIDYNKVVKYVRDNYGVHHLTSRRLDNEWSGIQAALGINLTKRQFDFLESWLKVSLSGGESRMLQEMLKIQKYDPWRSGNLKPGDSFTKEGREAMKNESDYIGSDLFRFEQIGEDEIIKLIEEGYRKGEEVFVKDFSAEEFWKIFNERKNPETSYIADQALFQKYINTVENILTIRSNNLFRGNRGLGSNLDYMCSTLLKPMSKIEQVVRLGQFLTLEKEGFTRSEIFKSIADTQFEYELKSSKVKYAEFIMTYFNFEYNNIRYWCNMLESKPEYLYVLENLWNDLSWQASQEYYRDEDIYNNESIKYMMANGAIPIGSSGLYLKMFPSALGALNWFYGMPSQFTTSIIPPAELLLKEMTYRMGGDYAQLFLSNMDYSYADQETWEKALSLVPVAGTLYTRYWQHATQRQPWKRLDNDSFGQWLVKCNPTVWGAIYKYNKPHKDGFDAFQAELELQGKWYDSNLDKVVDIKYKNTRGLNNPDFEGTYGEEWWNKLCAYKKIYRGEYWDNNWGGFFKEGHFTSIGDALFDENGNAKELGLNRYRNLSVPGEWEKVCEDQFKYHGRKWDRNTDKFVPLFQWKEEKLNRSDLTFAELQEYMAEKGKYWDAQDHKFKSVPENMHSSFHNFRRSYHHRNWNRFRRWVNYEHNPPAKKYETRPYNPGTTYNVSGKPFGTSYNIHEDNAALRMAVAGYKAYDEYYKFQFQYNYSYRLPNLRTRIRRYNPIIRYHIVPK